MYDAVTDSYQKDDIGERETVITNPIRKVDSYVLADANLLCTVSKKIGISVSIENIFNESYFHPGVRTADSGNTPGIWSGSTWTGSQGWFNSLMPQPGRTIWIALKYRV